MNVSLDFSSSNVFGANRERLSRATVETSSNKHLELSIEALMAAATETLMEVFDLTIRREIEEKERISQQVKFFPHFLSKLRPPRR